MSYIPFTLRTCPFQVDQLDAWRAAVQAGRVGLPKTPELDLTPFDPPYLARYMDQLQHNAIYGRPIFPAAPVSMGLSVKV